MPTTPRIKVIVNSDGTIQTDHRVVKETTPYVNRAKQLVELTDVDTSDALFSNGSTLVYNATREAFVIKPLDSGDILPFGNIDGGSF